MSLRDIGGHVSSRIDQPVSNETRVQLKELLTQIQSAVESEPASSEAEKADALGDSIQPMGIYLNI